MIIHMTTVHPRDDSRILYKEIGSLLKGTGEDVRLFVQDGKGDEVDARTGCQIIDTGSRLPRVARMTKGAWRMTSAVRKARPTLVFFHDPELLPWAVLLRLTGIKVVYDAHEDMPQTVLHNTRIRKSVRPLLAQFAKVVELACAGCMSAVVGATNEIVRRFPARKSFLLRNYPIIDELYAVENTPMAARNREFTYVGTITENRNIHRMIDAVDRVPEPGAELRLAGEFTQPALMERVVKSPGWAKVRYEGWIDRKGVADILSHSRGGLVLLEPIPHEMVTLPIKLFEYMAAGVPVIASDFPLWREIVDGAACGLLVDPEDTDAISDAMQWLIANPDEAQAMGQRGRRAVLEQYNWEKEAERLLRLCRFVQGGTDKSSPTL